MRDHTIVYRMAGRKADRNDRRGRGLPVIAALAACVIAFSILLLLAAVLGQDIREWNDTAVIGAFFFMSGIIWGLLLLVNR